jgi:hypothetical protein
MSKILHLPSAKPGRTKVLPHTQEANRFISDPLIAYYDKTISFFNNHSPGKLTKDLYKLIFALMEHQANNAQPVNFTSSIYDIKQLLNFLEETDRLQQTGELSQHFFDVASEFMYENDPVNLGCNLCRIMVDFMRYELKIGYPSFISEFLSHFIALLEWLSEGASLVKLDPK